MKPFIIPMTVFAANCYLLTTGQGRGVVIDPGAQAERIIKALEERGGNLAAILLTHGHFDHIGAVSELLEYWPQAQVYMSPKEEGTVADTRKSHVEAMGLPHSERYQISEYLPLVEGEEIMVDDLTFLVMETPGHTKGSVCIACGDYLFTGDTLFHHDYGRTDLFGGSPSEMLQSLKRLGSLEQNYIILPGHEDSSTIDEERDFITGVLREYGL